MWRCACLLSSRYTDEDEIAVCNLASINLSKFVDEETRTYDFKGLAKVQCVEMEPPFSRNNRDAVCLS